MTPPTNDRGTSRGISGTGQCCVPMLRRRVRRRMIHCSTTGKRPMPAKTHLFRCLKDNFGVLLHDPASGATAAIDAPEAAPVDAALKATGWRLSDILVTHHHADHTGGIAELKARHRCRVTAPRHEAARIPDVDATVGEGDIASVGALAC